MAIERSEIERLAKDRDDEREILERNIYGRLASCCGAERRSSGPKAFRRATTVTSEVLSESRWRKRQWWEIGVDDAQSWSRSSS